MKRALINIHKFGILVKGELPGNHITSETSKRVGLRPQKETTPENLAFHGFKQKTHLKHEAET